MTTAKAKTPAPSARGFEWPSDATSIERLAQYTAERGACGGVVGEGFDLGDDIHGGLLLLDGGCHPRRGLGVARGEATEARAAAHRAIGAEPWVEPAYRLLARAPLAAAASVRSGGVGDPVDRPGLLSSIGRRGRRHLFRSTLETPRGPSANSRMVR